MYAFKEAGDLAMALSGMRDAGRLPLHVSALGQLAFCAHLYSCGEALNENEANLVRVLRAPVLMRGSI